MPFMQGAASVNGLTLPHGVLDGRLTEIKSIPFKNGQVPAGCSRSLFWGEGPAKHPSFALHMKQIACQPVHPCSESSPPGSVALSRQPQVHKILWRWASEAYLPWGGG